MNLENGSESTGKQMILKIELGAAFWLGGVRTITGVVARIFSFADLLAVREKLRMD